MFWSSDGAFGMCLDLWVSIIVWMAELGFEEAAERKVSSIS